MRTLPLFLLIAIFGVEIAAAQANPDSVKQRNDCRLAEQVITTGHPRRHAVWASSQLRTCGGDAFSRSIAAGLERLRTSSDTTALSVLWNRALLYVNSRSVFNQGLAIAADPSASTQAREFALTGLLRMLKPDAVIWLHTVTRTDREGHYRSSFCYDGVTAGIRPQVIGSPVDASAAARMREAGQMILGDASAPAGVRAAAYCAARL